MIVDQILTVRDKEGSSLTEEQESYLFLPGKSSRTTKNVTLN